MTTAGLAWSDVSGRVGQSFALDAGPTLTLVAAAPLSGGVREGGSFRLEFAGPAEPALPQATYRFTGPDFASDIFIVPVAREAGGGYRYEAIFF